MRRRYMMSNNDKIVITRESNTPLMDVLYSKGLCAHSDYMTQRECNKVTGFPANMFKDNTDIISLDELIFFTKIVSLPENFVREASNLESIKLDNIVSLGSQNTFYGNEKCTSIGYTGNLHDMHNNALGGCNERYFFFPSYMGCNGIWATKMNRWNDQNRIVDFGAKVTAMQMGWRWFGTKIVFRSPAPPTYSKSNQNERITRIYVPASSLSLYIDSDWGTAYPNIIFAIGGNEWQEQFASAPDPTYEYADVVLYAPSEYVNAYIAKYEEAKNATNS